MKTSLRLIACALVLFGALVMPSLAQQKGPHEAEFRTFYAAFVKAVQATDKEKIADMIAYPVSSWSIQTKGDVQEGSLRFFVIGHVFTCPKKADAPKKCSASVSVVFRVENFEGSLLALKSKGLLPDSTEKDAHGQFAHFHDPDGNEVTIWGGKI